MGQHFREHEKTDSMCLCNVTLTTPLKCNNRHIASGLSQITNVDILWLQGELCAKISISPIATVLCCCLWTH